MEPPGIWSLPLSGPDQLSDRDIACDLSGVSSFAPYFFYFIDDRGKN